jgi:hypothetical protein
MAHRYTKISESMEEEPAAGSCFLRTSIRQIENVREPMTAYAIHDPESGMKHYQLRLRT